MISSTQTVGHTYMTVNHQYNFVGKPTYGSVNACAVININFLPLPEEMGKGREGMGGEGRVGWGREGEGGEGREGQGREGKGTEDKGRETRGG